MGVRDRSLRFLPMSARNGIFRAEAPPLARLAECLPAHARGRTLSPSPSVPRRPPPGLSRPVERGRAIPLTRPGRAALRTRGRLTTGGGRVSRALSAVSGRGPSVMQAEERGRPWAGGVGPTQGEDRGAGGAMSCPRLRESRDLGHFSLGAQKWSQIRAGIGTALPLPSPHFVLCL